ncbi:MAG: hypothetical protein HY674_00310 [Chloroflexi bacterium]|nr:hypothetical protein [Chloroflexota bacterium]
MPSAFEMIRVPSEPSLLQERRRMELIWRRVMFMTALIFFGTMAAPSEQAGRSGEPPNPPLTNAPLKEIEPGIFELGKVRLHKQQRSLSFPATLNMTQGLIEYALVSSTGKLHESLLQTEVEPYHIHLAALLLGVKCAGADSPEPSARPAPAPVVSGGKVSVWISWKRGGAEKRCRLESLILNLQTKSPMSPGAWIYSGSRVVDGTFLAQRDGSLITIIADPDALVNNPRPGRENDEIWEVNSAKAPPSGTAVNVTIRLAEEKE